VPLSAAVPAPEDFADETARAAAERALEYMDLTPGTPMREIAVNTVFIGSGTKGGTEDLCAAAARVATAEECLPAAWSAAAGGADTPFNHPPKGHPLPVAPPHHGSGRSGTCPVAAFDPVEDSSADHRLHRHLCNVGGGRSGRGPCFSRRRRALFHADLP